MELVTRFKHVVIGDLDNRALEYANKAALLGQIKPHAISGTSNAFLSTHVTICDLYDKDTGKLVSRGYAFCTQPYNRRIGRNISLGRARKAAGLSTKKGKAE